MEFTDPLFPDSSITIQGKSHLLGFPVVINESLPEAKAFMVLPESPDNQTGEIELHMRSFVGMPDCELEIILDGQVLTTVIFTSGGEPERDIARELNAHLDSDMPIN